MNDTELRQLALDAVDGKVFGSWQLGDPEDLPMVFMVLPMMSSAQFADFQQRFVHAYEYLDRAGERSINGMPMFFTARGLTADEWTSMSGYARELLAQRDAFLNGSHDRETGPRDSED